LVVQIEPRDFPRGFLLAGQGPGEAMGKIRILLQMIFTREGTLQGVVIQKMASSLGAAAIRKC
jgi:hypothetical protein